MYIYIYITHVLLFQFMSSPKSPTRSLLKHNLFTLLLPLPVFFVSIGWRVNIILHPPPKKKKNNRHFLQTPGPRGPKNCAFFFGFQSLVGVVFVGKFTRPNIESFGKFGLPNLGNCIRISMRFMHFCIKPIKPYTSLRCLHSHLPGIWRGMEIPQVFFLSPPKN